MNVIRWLVGCAALLGTLAAGATAAVAAPPLGLGDCRSVERTHQCSGLVPTWDGVPLDVTLTLPSAGASRLPLVVLLHGLGNSKEEYLNPAETAYTDNAYAWARAGYAVLTSTARGFWGSCGTPESRTAQPAACARGYIHLADTRYEVRDTQELVGRLVDDGLADPKRIGVTGDSYGGGQSFALAALNDRVMLPDGRLVPWRSPRGTPLRLAAAAPVIPWTNLIGAIAPNGLTQSVGVTPRGSETQPVGVFKTSVANAIFAATTTAIGPGQPAGQPFVPGRPIGFLSPPGSDPQTDIAAWVARADAGEPYTEPYIRDVIDQIVRFRSADSIGASSAPPPLFVGSGFTDDLFPVDETLRFVNRTRRDHPDTPVSLLLGDFGHQRAANKPDVRARLIRDIRAWFDHYVRGDAPTPPRGVAALTQTCPVDAPSGGPFTAPAFAELARGEVRAASGTRQTVTSGGGDPATAGAIDPAAGGGDGCVQTPADDAPGTAVLRLPAATGDGMTLLGAPAITARLRVSGADPSVTQVAARLWDVEPGGRTQTLVARGLYRPSGGQSDSWELHPNGWRFAKGHIPRLELLGSDAPYGRPSNAAFSIAVDRLELRLPVREQTVAASATSTARRCVSRRRFSITLPTVRGGRVVSVRVSVGARRARVRRGRRLRATIDLRGLPRGVVRVRAVIRLRGGRTVVRVRRYRTCAPRRA